MENINKYYDLLLQEYNLISRIIYKFKNQHGRLNYFRSIFRITNELKIFIIAYNETFNNSESFNNIEIYLKNINDVKRIIRRIKWDLKSAGLSISRLLAHGFHLPLVFLLLSVLSRIYSIIINLEITIKLILKSLKCNNDSKNYSNITKQNNLNNSNNNLNNIKIFDEEEIDFGEIVDNVDNNINLDINNNNINHNENINVDIHVDNNYEVIENRLIKDKSSLDHNLKIRINKAWNNHLILRSKRRKLR